MDFKHYNYFSGYNDTTELDNLQDHELVKCENAIPMDGGGFQKRPGITKLFKDGSTNVVTQIIVWQNPSTPIYNTRDILVVAFFTNDQKYYLCLVDAQGNFEKISVVDTAQIGYIVKGDQFYFCNGGHYLVYGRYDTTTNSDPIPITANMVVKKTPNYADVPVRYYKAKIAMTAEEFRVTDFSDTSKWEDVTAFLSFHSTSLGTVVPKDEDDNILSVVNDCTIIEYHPPSFRYFFSGSSKDSTAIYYSEPNDPTYIKNTSILYPTSASGPVVGMKSFSDALMVGYRNCWMAWKGVTPGVDASWKKLTLPYGLVSHYTIQETPESITFLSHRGICVVYPEMLDTGNTTMLKRNAFELVSESKIEKTIKSINKTIRGKLDVVPQAIFFDGWYYLCYEERGELPRSGRILAMHWNSRGFSLWTYQKAYSFATDIDDRFLIIGGGTGLLKLDEKAGEDNNTTIKMEVITKPINCGDPFYKRFETVHIVSNQNENSTDGQLLKIDILIDYLSDLMTTDLNESFVWGQSYGKVWGFSKTTDHWSNINKPGYRIQFKFTEATPSGVDRQLLKIYSLSITYDTVSDIDGEPMQKDLLI